MKFTGRNVFKVIGLITASGFAIGGIITTLTNSVHAGGYFFGTLIFPVLYAFVYAALSHNLPPE